ncbi:MAG: DUF87 domain-containing protein [Ignisphaera sp.]
MRRKIALLDTISIPLTLFMSNKNDYNGIYVGIDIVSGSNIYWDISRSFSPHILVIGPTGSGKTLTLAAIANRFKNRYAGCAIFMDVKNEYSDILTLYNYKDIFVIDPVKTSLPLCFCHDDKHQKLESVNTVVDVLAKVFSLHPTKQRILQKILLETCIKCSDINDSLTISEEILLDRDIEEALETAMKLFNVYLDVNEHPLAIQNSKKTYVVNLKSLFLRNKVDSAAVILYTTRFILEELGYSLITTPKIIMVIDELWHALPYLAEDFITVLTRYSRSFGLSILMATQGIDDLYPYSDTIVNSCGGLISMASSSIAYWQRLRRYLNLSNKSIEKALTLCNQGEAVARFSPQNVPLFLYIDPLEQ